MAYFMSLQQDAIGLVAFDEAIRVNLSAGGTAMHLKRLLEELEALKAGGRTALPGRSGSSPKPCITTAGWW